MTKDEVKITKILNSSIEKVWDAWTNPESMKDWLSPEGMINPEVSNELKIGGNYRIVMEGDGRPDSTHNGRMPVGGKYLEIEKPSKLVFTWLWEGSPEETHTTTVTILLKKIGDDRTEMILIHTDFADENMRREHRMGWDSTFKKLESFFKGGGYKQ